MELILRSLQEDGTTDVNSDFSVSYYIAGVLTSILSSGTPNITIPDIDNNSEVTIQITSAGRYTYNKVINVYNQDLDLRIKLTPEITDINNPNYLNPYPFFFIILNPCTYQVEAYDASSAPFGAGSWYVNNELYSNSNGTVSIIFPAPGNYQIKRRVAVEDPAPGYQLLWDRYYANGSTAEGSIANDVPTNLALDTTANETQFEIVPEIDIVINAPSDILNGVTYYNRLDTMTVTTSITFTSPYLDPSFRVLNYEVIDPNGNIVATTNPEINLDVTDPDTETSFVLNTRGDYTIRAKVTDECTTHIVEKIIPAYNFVQILPVEEHIYNVRNSSNTIIIDYVVECLQAGGFVPFQGVTTVNTKEDSELVLSKQGVYQVTYTFIDFENNERTETIILHYYGELKDCLTNLTMNILCTPEGGCGCDDISATGSLLEMYSLSQTYFMYLQEEYGFNNIYTALDNAKIADLADIDVFLKKLEKYCKTFSCSDNKPCSCGTCASCLNKTATNLQIISGRLSQNSNITDCGCGGSCGGSSSGGCGCG